MATTDQATAQTLPADAIQRVLFIAAGVHVYKVPPITSASGFNAASWTQNPRDHIFTCRLRVIETAIPTPASSNPENERVSIAILLEDPSSGELFAACPYTHPAAVERANDSSRFFAVRVVGEGGMKATLGIGFEDRAESLDFSIVLQDSRKVLGLDQQTQVSRPGRRAAPTAASTPEKKDFSLKEGEMITVNIGGKSRRSANTSTGSIQSSDVDALFSIKPPPSGGGGASVPFLPPPPSASSVKKERRRSREPPRREQPSAQDLGFDDGEFGEFQ